VPLSKIQIQVLRHLAAQRDPESYIAGASPLNRNASRFSDDIDIFHDREDRVLVAATGDAELLEAAGYSVRWLRRFPTIQTAEVSRDESRTRLEWVVDSDFRFFPTVPDEIFGYVLHPVDLAMNKVMAAAGRRAVRDLVDLMTIHETILPLGAVVWAVVEKSPGFTPEGLLAEIRRNSHYPAEDWKALETTIPLDPKLVMQKLRAIFDDTEGFVSRMPSEKAGLLFLKDGQVVLPDPTRLEDYIAHAGKRRGQWPSSLEIAAAMFERYNSKP
jgi:hypothetical protein